ncbi:SDR family oxidoreductase [Cohnella zeiphila]|uniref:NAD(P)H-binding protein n=1 Tax=Cohnella zeiphila TaxID=2761120 RepID=A0A7X0ST55_9BACL|nr:NAD(P)H-binding protein [Cohnella zeiphila]MBB6735643.1 NAD(P)H-binding protein [Cohnella zeiphila]
MKVAIVGGTGMLGRHVSRELRARGHEARALSRSSEEYPVDLTTGEGLEAALGGCDAVVDASNNATSKAATVLVEGTRHLLAAERSAGIGHHVCVSIVGCERVPFGYFKAKADQEREVEGGPVPWSIVRATQFHEYVRALFEQAGRWKVVPKLDAPLQTVAVAEVARAVADVVEGGPLAGRLEIAGPEIIGAGELARIWRRVTGRRALLLPVPLPGKLGQALRSGAATQRQPHITGSTRFEAWLKAEGR